ncbi:phage gp6-like head-tail connector protein [Lederbergia sp. NSJ-179]|uniref:phage gp6-like head-tail connector protein n=1 Tax=Lederbergia sp. NSJ-179 TaxID=2931402 RepID=UPI001FD43507|nr:phage gp6-like head-tail connector protein [Lederbergia sp. NSJ-179]MCJ7840510.1 phage gp6-like head-tail connector protein [Lederbergia sp. NSJ-179]
MADLIDKLKSHIHWEEGMDESNLPFYLETAQKYVKKATGKESEYLVIMVAGIMYDYRVSDYELEQALSAITPFIVQEVYDDGAEDVQEETNEQA